MAAGAGWWYSGHSAGATSQPWHHLHHQPTAPVYTGKLLPSITFPQFLQLNAIHVRVSLAASQRPVCRRITTVSWAELPRAVAFDPVPSVPSVVPLQATGWQPFWEHNSQNGELTGWMAAHCSKKRMIIWARHALWGRKKQMLYKSTECAACELFHSIVP